MTKTTAEQQRAMAAADLPVAPVQGWRQVPLVIQAMRPREWTKNLLLFAGVFFAGHLLQWTALWRAVIATVAFCAASGAIYIFNDLLDIRRDRLHPTKRLRPLASGALSRRAAVAGMVAATVLAFALAAVLARLPLGGTPAALVVRLWPPSLSLRPATHAVSSAHDPYAALGGSVLLFGLLLAAYIALQVAYSLRLKHIVLVDVFAIAAGFVLRALAGAVAVAVPISSWLYLCTILLSLFLGLSKRRQEVVLLEDGAIAHRQILEEYSLPLLDQLITIVTSATIITYSLYTFQSETAGDRRLMVTIPFAIYGIFRYLYLVQQRQMGGNPAEVLLRDRHIQVVVVGWIAVALFVLYVVPR
jgi:4-hydroxybenzoate polyprenyltransferase